MLAQLNTIQYPVFSIPYSGFSEFYGDDAVRSLGNLRPGHDADRLALPDGLGRDLARRNILDDLKHDGCGLDIRVPHSKAVHGRVVPRRDVERRGDVLRQDAAQEV
ncbi:MAG: hypothetical protein PHO09_03040, partial [Sphaerochaeta sp.]|nr:hypothetical protein [Sphaerochaeta sp.]